MKKISVVIILVAGFLTSGCFLCLVTNAQDKIVTQIDNQVINDEGYGNADAEYYNSEDDVVNDDGNITQ